MRHLFTVFKKELLDAIRDRRSLLSALLTPALIPLLIATMMHVTIEKNIPKPEEKLSLPVSGVQHAPNLVRHLTQQNFLVQVIDLNESEIKQAVKDGQYHVALLIPASYADDFNQGMPARLQLIQDTSNADTGKTLRRVKRSLYRYSDNIRVMRMQIRGISPYSLRPIVLQDIEVSATNGKAFRLLASIPFLLFLVTLMGGFYHAIDATAGERERGSLEPLLALPVKRSAIVIGKILATSLFMLISLLIVLIIFVFSLSQIDFAALGVSMNFTALLAGKLGMLMVPFTFFGAALMTFVASFTKTYKEAQTYLSIVIMIPTLPMLFIMIVLSAIKTMDDADTLL